VTPPVETQPERTALAWQRTGLGVLAVGGLLAHGAVRNGRHLLLAAAGVVALTGLLVLGWLAPVRYHQVLRAVSDRTAVSGPRTATAVTAAAVLTCAMAALGVLTLT
jgi:putative membrane protein